MKKKSEPKAETEKKSKAKKVLDVIKKDLGKKKPTKPETITEKAQKLAEDIKQPETEIKEEKKEKVKSKKKKAKEEKPVLERVYTVPLRALVPRPRRTKLAAHNLKSFVKKHTKAEKVSISQEVNEKLWERSYKKPPAKIRIKVEKDSEGTAIVKLK